MIELRNINKSFQKETILKDITITFEAGKRYGIVGENGSGKSVLLKTIAGFIRPDAGEVIINGSMLKKGEYIHDAGVMIEGIGFMPFYSGRENLREIAKIQNVIDDDRIKEVMEWVGLNYDSNKMYRGYSLGMKQKLLFAQAFMENPLILLLDEPMNSLDKESVLEMRNKVNAYVDEKNALLIITSHNEEDIKELCDEVYRIENGKMEKLIIDK